MTLQVLFKSRAYGYEPQPSALDFAVNSFSKNAIGGPDECQIDVQGGENQLAQLTEYLGKPIEIYDEIGRPAWWGRVNEIRFNGGGLALGWTLGQMANRVQVAYTEIGTNSQDAGYGTVTDWANDLTSQSLYGTVELRYSTGNGNGTAGSALRDRILAERGMPVAVLANIGEMSQSAAMYCKGWYSGMENRYGSIEVYGAGSGRVSFEGSVTVNRTMGSSAANTRYARQVLINQTLNIQKVSVNVRKVGAPTDNLIFELAHWTPSGALSGELLLDVFPGGIGTIAGTAIGTAYAWYETTLPQTVTPTNADAAGGEILFGLSFRRSGAVDASNFYQVAVGDEGGYTWHTLPLTDAIYNGSQWDMIQPLNSGILALHRMDSNNNVNSAYQASDLAIRYGQHFAAVINDATGLIMPSYKSGDVKARQSFEDVLKIGESGGNRLLCNVDVNRIMRIYEEPDNTTVGYYMDKAGQFTDNSGAIVPGHLVEPGKWIKAKDTYLWMANSQLGDAGLFLAESVSWGADGRVDVSPRTMPGEYEINPLAEVS